MTTTHVSLLLWCECREILSRYRVTGEADQSAAFLQTSVCDADNRDCSQPAPLQELTRAVMRDHYPEIEVYRWARGVLSIGQSSKATTTAALPAAIGW